MRKYNINKLENKFHVTIYTKRNTLINIIKWCKDNNIKNPTPVNKKIPATVRLRKDRSFRTIKRKNRYAGAKPYGCAEYYRNSLLKTLTLCSYIGNKVSPSPTRAPPIMGGAYHISGSFGIFFQKNREIGYLFNPFCLFFALILVFF